MKEGNRNNNILLVLWVSVLLLQLHVVNPCEVKYLRAKSGDIKSYFYPRCYPKHYCQDWKIVAPTGYRIKFQFKDFNLGPCNDGHRFTVLNGWHPKSQYLCGQRPPPPIESLGNDMLVYFPYQPWRTQGCRFWAHYEMINENEPKTTQRSRMNTTLGPPKSNYSVIYLTTSSGDIRSHFYPKNYPNDFTQQWLIKVAKDYRIRLKFKDFNVGNCTRNGDHLDVWHGKIPGRMLELCGQQLPFKIESSESEMELYFYSHPESRGGRFWAHYESFYEPKTVYRNPTLKPTRVKFDNGNGPGPTFTVLVMSMIACACFLLILTIYCLCKRQQRRQYLQSPTPANTSNNADLENEIWIAELYFADSPPSYEEVSRQSISDISSSIQQPSGENTATDSSGLPSYREALRLSQPELFAVHL